MTKTPRILLIMASLATITSLGGDEPGKAPAAQVPEGQLSPQQLADRFLKIRATLDKPGERPEYDLGEPVVVQLEMRNMAEAEEHVFWIPGWTYAYPIDQKQWYSAPAYLVTAKRYDREVPLTERGKATEKLMKEGPALLGGFAWRFTEDLTHPRNLQGNGITTQPFPAKAMANLLCDMTQPGEYELEVKFVIKVPTGDPMMPFVPVTTVVRDKSLRLRVMERLHRINEPRKETPKPQ